MFRKKRNIIILSAILLVLTAALGIILWFFFPVILRAVSPTRYTHYALARTGKILSAEIAEINDFFDFPDLSGSDVTHLTIDASGISANLSYGGLTVPGINLSNLGIGIDLLHDRGTKQASLDLYTSFNDNSFFLTLYTNVEQIALGINNDISWAVNADSIGKELAGLGLPVPEDFQLDLGFLFPDILDEGKMEDIAILLQDFIKSLKFIRNKSAGFFINEDGAVMTALISSSAFESLVYELSVHITKDHIVQAARVTVNVNTDSTFILTAQLFGSQNMLNHILLDAKIGNDLSYSLYSLESKGQNVPVDNKIIGTTIINGFDTGEIQVSYDIEKDRALFITAQLGGAALDIKGALHTDDDKIGLNLIDIHLIFNQVGTVKLSGNFDIAFGKASQEIRDLTDGAYNIADFEVFELFTLLQIVWDIIRQDQTLVDIIAPQLIDLILTHFLGNILSSILTDQFGEVFANLLSDVLHDIITEHFVDILDIILNNDVLDNLSDLLGELLSWLS